MASQEPNSHLALFLRGFKQVGIDIQTAIYNNFKPMEKEMWEHIKDLQDAHELECAEMHQAMMALDDRLHTIEDHLIILEKGRTQFCVDHQTNMQRLDERQTLCHDLAYSTFFRHLEGYQGVMDQWSSCIARVEAHLNLPIGRSADYRLGSPEAINPQALEQAKSEALIHDKDEEELLCKMKEFITFAKGKGRAVDEGEDEGSGHAEPPTPGLSTLQEPP
ncbi:hypothetical protein HYPSUDRAFT_200558 [Hypholoma sublateritium FD-334 SS-4]|uniref:Uncharacterized protein n=1 Tax=Hypholoma sublateritium (strain FD-334 SS-4) TaxID=945553 RepID=A0A0D2PY37_HYPSF|nr:hypothetical protein HYPSUDRAFT_200558 [Hypholoma sublateritium FD-334 SS-4]